MSNIRSSDEKGFLTSGENISYWIDSVKPLEFETLNKSIEADILIIGGGIAGLTTAYQLLRSGRNITLMIISQKQTSATSANCNRGKVPFLVKCLSVLHRKEIAGG